MKVIDPGHKYEVDSFDGECPQTITFMKREGPGYPGNVGHYPGTNLQEGLRVFIHRTKYLDNQVPSQENRENIYLLRCLLANLEVRAARRHHIAITLDARTELELTPTCSICGHFITIPIHNHEAGK